MPSQRPARPTTGVSRADDYSQRRAGGTEVTNIATASGGGDTQPSPSGPDPTTVAGQPQLTITKSHPDPVVQGERGLPFSLLVSNNGSGPTTGTVAVTDTLPAGLALVDATGSGWNCVIAASTVTCSRSDALAQAQGYPAIQIRADVAAGATSTVNEATVSGGGDTTPNDNVARDPVSISPAGQPNLILTKEHDGDFTQGQQGAAYRVRVANVGQAPTTGLVTVTDNLPAGLTPTSASGSGWACTIASQSVTCTRSDALAPGAAYPLIVLLVNVAANATNLANVATLTGGGDQTTVDNTSTDETHIVARAPDFPSPSGAAPVECGLTPPRTTSRWPSGSGNGSRLALVGDRARLRASRLRARRHPSGRRPGPKPTRAPSRHRSRSPRTPSSQLAGFTSQQSSNLAWGGIKYMESLEFALVRKLCRRATT